MHVTRRHSQKGIACRQLGNPTDKAFSPGPFFLLILLRLLHPDTSAIVKHDTTTYHHLRRPRITESHIQGIHCFCDRRSLLLRAWGGLHTSLGRRSWFLLFAVVFSLLGRGGVYKSSNRCPRSPAAVLYIISLLFRSLWFPQEISPVIAIRFDFPRSMNGKNKKKHPDFASLARSLAPTYFPSPVTHFS